ncbi:sensor histidine kinase [Ornithinibacillus gellani]|uniref:sensor histidine kinase n=1 Tax=Ornithinibacillus gellani TaxID=2293253 RepID=UPI000F496BF2|nr:sensor histidine kinase [Ornithinibacillus gellani]TQS71229.1 sensor histidine kinase [Ornithinibacillus gellani]
MKPLQGKNFKDATRALFLKYTVIPILLIIILFLVFTVFVFKIKAIHDTKQSAQQVESEIMTVYQTYLDELEYMANASAVKETLRSSSKNHYVYEEFYNFNNQQTVKSAFHFVDKRDVFLAQTIPSDHELNKKIIRDILPWIDKNPEEIYMDANRTEFINGKVASFTIGKAVMQEGQVAGYLIYQLYEEDLERLIFGKKADIIVLADDYDYIIASTNSIVVGLMNKFSPEHYHDHYVKIKDDNYYMSKIAAGDFSIYALKNMKNDHLVFYLYVIFLALIGVLLFFLLKNLAEKMSSQNAASIDKLMQAVTKLEKGDMTAYVHIQTGDEFEMLAQHYNKMLDNLNELMEKNRELSNIRRIKEIKLLESQFNPHFMFNVLETLRYTMFIDREQAQEIIFSLSRLLRYSIHKDDQLVPFEQDLNYIVDYLQLHQYRFQDRLDYELDVADTVRPIFVPRLLLQPLIENAIKYGYQTKTHLHILISAKIKGNQIVFSVQDDGPGIEAEKLAAIRENLKTMDSTNLDIGIGLYNTHRRMVLQYGEDYGIQIDSSIGVGTTVTIKMPYKGAKIDV